MKHYEITIENDHHEAEEFAAWIVEQGHSAEIGAGNYVDGVHTSVDSDANDIMNRLWDDYCNS